jgi:hypothetical protein
MKDYSEEITLRQIRANIAAGEGNENVDEVTLSGVQNDAAALRLANPATLKAAKIAAFFKDAPGITTQFKYEGDGLENPTLYVFVTDADQADYLNRVIIRQHSLGGIMLDVKVVQACAGDIIILDAPSDTLSLTKFEIFARAVKGIPNVVRCFSVHVALFNIDYNFCETAPKLCFYQADDISNVEGFEAAPPSELIKEVFDFEGDERISCFISTYVPRCEKK